VTHCTFQKTILLSRVVYLWEEYIVADVRALRDMHIKVPEAVRVGDSVTLACNYDLESAALYTIKWYRYDSEFYRYVPKESPPSRVFVMPHLTVDVSTLCLFYFGFQLARNVKSHRFKVKYNPI
jgi:purine-cytosine permease-like protein